MSNLQVRVDFPSNATDLLDRFPDLVQFQMLDSALRKASKVVLNAAREMSPRGNDEDRQKRSKKQKASADWNTPLQKTIIAKIIKTRTGGAYLVGPSWPKGNKAHFDWGDKAFAGGRRQVQWGRPTGKQIIQSNHWLKRALDLSLNESIGVFVATIEAELSNL